MTVLKSKRKIKVIHFMRDDCPEIFPELNFSFLGFLKKRLIWMFCLYVYVCTPHEGMGIHGSTYLHHP